MKRYKLLKDLPTFKAGDEFYLDSNNSLRFKGSDIMAYNHKTLEKFPNILTDWFEEILEYERRRAEYRGLYYYVNSLGIISSNNDYRDTEDDHLYSIGNYGLTKEELESKLKYDIARKTLLDDAEGGKFSRKGCNWHAYYDGVRHKMDWDYDYSYNPGTIYFKTQKALEESLERHKKQWEIVREYEMGEL